MDIEKLIK